MTNREWTGPLSRGQHDDPTDGACLLEAAAWVACGEFTDHPTCVSPVLGAYGRALNDAMTDDETRELLRPLIPRLIGTAGDGKDQARAYLAADRAVRHFASAALDAAGLTWRAIGLRMLRPITDAETAELARAAARAAESAAAAAAESAPAAAWSAAWSAESAAESAAWSAAAESAAAESAAWSAAWSAAAAWSARAAGSAWLDAVQLFSDMIDVAAPDA